MKLTVSVTGNLANLSDFTGSLVIEVGAAGDLEGVEVTASLSSATGSANITILVNVPSVGLSVLGT